MRKTWTSATKTSHVSTANSLAGILAFVCLYIKLDAEGLTQSSKRTSGTLDRIGAPSDLPHISAYYIKFLFERKNLIDRYFSVVLSA